MIMEEPNMSIVRKPPTIRIGKKLPSEHVENFLLFIDEIRMQVAVSKHAYDESNLQIQDLLHFLEFGNVKDDKDRIKIAKEITSIRRFRRGHDDRNEIFSVVQDWANSHPSEMRSIEKLAGDVRKAEHRKLKRSYQPRTDIVTDLFGAETKHWYFETDDEQPQQQQSQQTLMLPPPPDLALPPQPTPESVVEGGQDEKKEISPPEEKIDVQSIINDALRAMPVQLNSGVTETAEKEEAIKEDEIEEILNGLVNNSAPKKPATNRKGIGKRKK
jgi:hypothetical protein